MSQVQNELPKKIGPYKILKQLGSGGMGVVYRAVHVDLKRDVALKVLAPNSARNDILLKRFLLEARAAAMPYHENVVLFYEHGQADGFHYMALEYVRGKDLSYILRQHRQLPVSFTVHVIKQAARALEHAHKHGYVHRDIKPSNLLITKDKLVKLTDMGLARQLEELEDNKVTRDGTTVGTVDYMAPEQAQDSRAVDIRGDIYSLGCTWFQMLAGSVPYRGGTALERLYKHASDPIPDVRDLNPKVPESVAYTIEKMMAKSPADRFQTPAELLEELEHLDLSRSSSPASLADLVAEDDFEDEEATPRAIRTPPSSTSSRAVKAPPVDRSLIPEHKRGLNPIWALSVLGVLLLIVGIVALKSLNGSTPPVIEQAVANESASTNETAAGDSAVASASSRSINIGGSKAGQRVEPTTKTAEPAAPTTTERLDRGQVLPLTKAEQDEIYGPWQTPDRLQPEKSFTVHRLEQQTGEGDEISGSLSQAWRAAAKEMVRTEGAANLLIATQGPLFLSKEKFAGNRGVFIQPAAGFAPLAVFESAKSATNPQTDTAWFVFDGNRKVEIEGVHFTILADDLPLPNVPFALFALRDADLSLRKCTVTVLGKHASSVIVVALGAGTNPGQRRILIEDCVFRGESLTAVRTEHPADVLIENSCLMSNSQPLVTVAQTNTPADAQVELRIANSTLVSGREAFRLEWDNASEANVSVRTAGSVIAATESTDHRPLLLLDLDKPADVRKRLTWQSVRSAYASWPRLAAVLVDGKMETLAEDLKQWSRFWGVATNREIARTLAVSLQEGFVLDEYPELHVDQAYFDGYETVHAFLGYDARRCLTLSPYWFEHAYGEFAVEYPPAGDAGKATRVQVAVQSPQSLAEALAANSAQNLVLQVTGTGVLPVVPMAIKDRQVRLEFPKDGSLTLSPTVGATESLFTVQNGTLEIENGRFQWPDSNVMFGLARVAGSRLTLDRCQAIVPLANEPTDQALIQSLATDAEHPSTIALQDTLLAAPGSLFSVDAPHSFIEANNCVLVSNRDALAFAFQDPAKEWKAALSLESCTVSVAGYAVRVADYPAAASAPSAPMVIQVSNCLFTDWLDGARRRLARPRSGALFGVGTDVLEKQIVAWQGSYNGFDKRLTRFVALTSHPQSSVNFTKASIDWFRLWGIRHEAYPLLEQFHFETDLESRSLSLQGLALSPDDPGRVAASDGGPIGADLSVFGVKIKPSTRSGPPEYANTVTPLSKTFVLGAGNAPVITEATANRSTATEADARNRRSRQSRSDRRTTVRSSD